ncbi:MAG: ABC transporter ATP-binding protein [Caldisericaceae bacterium]
MEEDFFQKPTILKIEGLHVSVEGKEIIKGVSLSIREGETIALLGPNGCGKTTLLMTIMGFNGYEITEGRILFKGKELNHLPPYERARLGIGIAFQKPPKVKGVKLSRIIESIKKDKEYESYIDKLNLAGFIERDVNAGFSGGEVKRTEVLQLIAQKPEFVMFDEPESGVDLENIKLLGGTIAHLLEKDKIVKERKVAGLIITHTGDILDYVEAETGYVMTDGKIICRGYPRDILEDLRKYGFKECGLCQK